jgi:hypothetical protein
MRDRYYISFDAGVNYLEFFPTNEPKLTLSVEGSEIFKRWKVDKFRIGRTKNATVFDTIAGMFFDPAYFGTDLLYKINILGVDKFFFIDPVTSISLDNQNMVYEATPDPNDEYRPILQQYEKKFQHRELSNTLFGHTDTIHYPKLNTAVFIDTDFFPDPFQDTFLGVTGNVNWGNTGAGSKYATNLLDVITVNTDIVTIIIRSFTGSQFLLRLLDGGAVASADVTVTGNGKYQLTQNVAPAASIYVQFEAVGVSAGTFNYQLYYPTSVNSGGLLHDALEDLLNGATYMNLGLTIDSTILWNDALPTNPPAAINTYITANPTNDYVIEGAALWNNLWIARTDSFTTAKEDLLEYSLKDIMALLKKIRMYWFIDDDGHFRIEHERYFREFTPQADLTSAPYAPVKPEVDQRVYRYERTDSYNQLNYSEQNQDHEDWRAYPVSFPILHTSKSIKDISFAELSTDIQYITENPGAVSSGGLVLLRTVPMGAEYLVDMDQSVITPANYYINARLSWAWLFGNYYNYFAEAESGTINNGTAKTYTHVKEYLKQNNIRFRMTTDLDWKQPFTLLEGTGWVESAEYLPATGMYKIDVGFDPYTLVIYVVDSEDIGIRIVDDDGTTEIVL